MKTCRSLFSNEKYISFIFKVIEILLIYSLESNSRISVRSRGAWALKGRFNNAMRIREPLPWVYDEHEEAMFVELLTVSFYVDYVPIFVSQIMARRMIQL